MNYPDLADIDRMRVAVLDSKGELSPELSQSLRDGENVTWWREALRDALASSETEQHERKAQLLRGDISEANYEDWMHRNMTFQGAIRRRLSEAKILATRYNRAVMATRLRNAISAHRESTTEPSEADLELWKAYDETIDAVSAP